MSFFGYKDVIEEGDTVVLYLSASSIYSIEVRSSIKNKHGEYVDNVFQTTYGALGVKSMIGLKYGSKVELSKGWAYVLHPSCELWTLTLPHRTQIIYTPDISMIIFQLELSSGKCVVECGTGSGSLTHALARCVGPEGRVLTFDFHKERVDIAKQEFLKHQISNIVTVCQRDVCANGFGQQSNGTADAVFLDLPHPWMAVKHSIPTFKPSGGRLCSFSPCIEQVQKTCQALRSNGFLEIKTIECLQREFSVVNRSLPTVNLIKKEEEGGELSSSLATKGGASSWMRKYNFVSSSYGVLSPGHTGYLTLGTLPPVWARDYYNNIDDGGGDNDNYINNYQNDNYQNQEVADNHSS